jgi:hypothetical protein
MITVQNETMAMACRILDKKDPRAYVKHMMVKDGHAYTTDGKCMARIPCELPDGFYLPVRITKKLVDINRVEDFEYPGVKQVLDITNHTDITDQVSMDSFPAAMCTIARATDHEYYYNPDFIKKAYDIMAGGCDEIKTCPGGRPLVFINNQSDITLLVMTIMKLG